MPNLIEVTSLDIPELNLYKNMPEVQLLRYFEPQPGVFVAESPNVVRRALDAGYEPLSFLVEKKNLDESAEEIFARCGQVPVYVAESEVFAELTGMQMTRGLLSVMRRKAVPSLEKICEGAKRIVVLENVMNPTNVGAIFRSAAALGMDAVLLTKGCSDPLYRRAARVSMGTVFQIPWTYLDENGTDWPGPAMEQLKRMGFRTAAMALKEDSVGVDNPELLAEEKLAVVLGTEGDGLAENTIADCDYTVMIPMAHGVDSLNVAAASAVAFWQLGKRDKE